MVQAAPPSASAHFYLAPRCVPPEGNFAAVSWTDNFFPKVRSYIYNVVRKVILPLFGIVCAGNLG